MQTLGLILRDLRRERRMSQRELAAIAKLTFADVCDIENGNRQASESELRTISHFLQANADLLVLASRGEHCVDCEPKFFEAMRYAQDVISRARRCGYEAISQRGDVYRLEDACKSLDQYIADGAAALGSASALEMLVRAILGGERFKFLF